MIPAGRDHYVKVEKIKPQGFGARLGNSIAGVFIGAILFFVAFPVLWYGETRQNLADFVRTAKVVPSDALPIAHGLIKTTGKITSDETVNDPEFLNPINDKKILRLERSVEMYAWKEKKETERRGDEKITRHDYVREWTSTPVSSSSFDTPDGHENPALTINPLALQVNTAKVGVIPFNAAKTEFYDTKDLTISDAMLNKSAGMVLQAAGNKVYIHYGMTAPGTTAATTAGTVDLSGYGSAKTTPTTAVPMPTSAPGRIPTATTTPTPGTVVSFSARIVSTNPMVGDVRVSYRYFAGDVSGTVSGSWNGNMIEGHVYDKTSSFLGAYPGGVAEFEAHLNFMHKAGTWIFRVVTFLMMWIGLGMMVGPLAVLVESIPLIGGAGKWLISIVCGGIALVLWAATIFLANLWVVLVIAAGLSGGLFFYFLKASRSHPGLINTSDYKQQAR